MRWRGVVIFFSFKQKPAYEMRISDWSSDVCSSDLHDDGHHGLAPLGIGAPDHCNLAHRWVGREHPFHRRGPPVLAAGDDHVPPSPVHVEAATDQLPEVAGGVPAASVLEIGRASGRERLCQYV